MEYNKPATRQDVENMIKWLQTKPYEGMYNSDNTRTCLLAQFLNRTYGPMAVTVGPNMVHINGHHFVIPQVMNVIAMSSPHTYGAAMERARLALPDVIKADLMRESALSMK